MKRITLCFTVLLASLQFGTAEIVKSVAQRSKPTLIIPATGFAGVDGEQNWNAHAGQKVALALAREVSKFPSLAVVEKTDGTDATNKAAGGFVPDYSLITWVTGIRTNSSLLKSTVLRPFVKLPFTNVVELGGTQYSVELEWKLVCNHSGEIVQSGHVTGNSRCGNVKVEDVAEFGRREGAGLMDRALMKAVLSAVPELAMQVQSLQIPIPEVSPLEPKGTASAVGEILLIEGDKIYLSLGSDHGMAVGDKLLVYKTVTRKNQAGKEVSVHVELTELKVVHVSKTQSRAERTDQVPLQEGFIVAAKGAPLD